MVDTIILSIVVLTTKFATIDFYSYFYKYYDKL